jgi:hypothetical protein
MELHFLLEQPPGFNWHMFRYRNYFMKAVVVLNFVWQQGAY